MPTSHAFWPDDIQSCAKTKSPTLPSLWSTYRNASIEIKLAKRPIMFVPDTVQRRPRPALCRFPPGSLNRPGFRGDLLISNRGFVR
jgi:hypothetical protein